MASTLQDFLNNSIFFYSMLLLALFVVMIFFAAKELKGYMRRNTGVNFKQLLATPHAPSVTVILPVRNEAATVIERIKALLSLRYNNFELIVVNDGSSDNTLSALVDFYHLEAVNFAGYEQLKTQPINHYYKSSNPIFAKLTVVDKEYGGVADALNAGINISEKSLVLCLERKCFLDQLALLKLVKEVLDNDTRVISVGAAIYISNSSESKSGYLTDIRYPKSLLAALRSLHDLKVFLIERPAFKRFNGLHTVQDVVSLLDREIVIQSGGYSSETQNEGFELKVRMCRYMHDHGRAFKIISVPEPICWREEPQAFAAVSRQEVNSTKGSLQTLWIHRRLLFNRNYGSLGLLTLPYWVLSECITPFFKLITLGALVLLSVLGSLNYETSLAVILMTYCVAVLLSGVSLIFEEKSYRPYSSINDLTRILFLIFLEPIIYQPLRVYWKLAACFGRSRNYL